MKKVKLALLIVMCLMVVISSSITTFAADGENASSSGISGQKPLSFVSAVLEDSSKVDAPEGITTQPKFKLTFDKNVVNMLFWENNSKCFSIISADGENVPVSVTKIDDTVDFSMRQVIFVQPVNPLIPGTTYYLKISPDLRAKNGVATLGGTTSGKGVTITFKTKGQAVVQNTTVNAGSTVLEPTGNSVNTSSPATGTNSSTTDNISTTTVNNADQGIQASAAPNTNQVQNKTDTTTKDAPAESESNQEMAAGHENKIVKMMSDNWLAESVVLLIILWVAVEMIIKKKNGFKNKNQ